MSFIIPTVILGGSAAAIWYTTTNYTTSQEFGKYYSYRVPIDTLGLTGDDLQKKLTTTVESFSEYLKTLDIDSYHDTFIDEDLDSDGNTQYYLDFALPIVKENLYNDPECKADEDLKKEVSPTETLYTTINSNKLDFIFDLDTQTQWASPDDHSTVCDFTPGISQQDASIDTLVTSPKNISYTTDKKGVVLKISDDDDVIGNSKQWNDIYTNLIKDTTEDDTKSPEIYIIRDKQTLISRMHYILTCVYANKVYASAGWDDDTQVSKYFNPYYDGYYSLSKDELDWANSCFKNLDKDNGVITGNFLQGSVMGITDNNLLGYAADNKTFFNTLSNLSTIPEHGKLDVQTSQPEGIYGDDSLLYKLIDAPKDVEIYPATTSPTSFPKGTAFQGTKTFGTDWGWSWMKPYIYGVINKDNWTKYFPDKDPLDTSDKSKEENIGKWLVIGDNIDDSNIISWTEYTARQLHACIMNGFGSPTLPFKILTESNDWKPSVNGNLDITLTEFFEGSLFDYLANDKYTKGTVSTTNNAPLIYITDQTLSNGLFISSPLLGSIIGIAVCLLLIGILVSILYRVPGFFAAISTIGSAALSILLLTALGKPISLGMILGIIGGIALTVASIFAIMQRFKKHTKQDEMLVNPFKKGLVKSIWSVVDLHLITIILGAILFFFGGMGTTEFGITILVYPVVSLLMLGLWGLAMFLFFYNKRNIDKVHLIFRPKHLEKSEIGSKENISDYQTSFKTVKRFTKFNLFGLWREIIPLIIFLVLIAGGITILCIFGIHNSYDYFNGYRLAIPTVIDGGPEAWIAENNIQYEYISKTSDFWFLYSTNVFDSNFIHDGVFQQRIINYENTLDLKNIIIATTIFGGFMVIYSCIRLNWTSAIPVFVSTVFAPVLVISLIPILQIPVSTQTIGIYSLFLLFNALFTTTFVSNINNRWVRYKYNSFKDLRVIINNEIKSNIVHYFSYVTFISIGMIGINMLFSSVTLIFPFVCLIIGLIISLVVNITVVKSLLILFITLRYKYKIRVMQADFFFKKNYDDIDEQTIEGINKSTIGKIQL